MRITNIDNLSALLDRLATERIKEYNFDKQGKDTEAAHQREVVIEIKIKLNELFREVFVKKELLMRQNYQMMQRH